MNYELVLNNELYHHGIKGQKWGVRRFQNKNGSLTKSGKERYSDSKEKKKGLSDKQKATLKKVGIATAATAAALISAYAATKFVKANPEIIENGKKKLQKLLTKPVDVKSMTDEDLAAKVKRLNLEKSYTNLTNNKKKSTLSKFNEKIAPIATLTSTALTLYSNANRISDIVDKENNKRKKKKSDEE